jgi:hypothetical protein
MLHTSAFPVATGIVLACGGGCFGSGSKPAPPASCCTPPPVEVQAEARAETPASVTDEHGNPVAVRLPDEASHAGG